MFKIKMIHCSISIEMYKMKTMNKTKIIMLIYNQSDKKL